MATIKSIKIETETHKRVKRHCGKTGIKIEKFATEACEEKLAKETPKKP